MLLVLVAHIFDMFYFIFLQKEGNNRLKKPADKFCNIRLLFLLKLGSVGPVDQQINFVLPKVFALKFICHHFYITIIHQRLFF